MKKEVQYTVEVEREPGWWIIRVPALDGLTTQSRRLADVERNAREAIAVWTDSDQDGFALDVLVRAPEQVVHDLSRSKSMLDEATAKQKASAELTSQAIHHLTDDLGLTLREAGKVVGLSHQRVAQLAGKGR